MYDFDWDAKTGGYVLKTTTARFVASEIRPVFAEELKLIGYDSHFTFDPSETLPLMWARKNEYWYRGDLVAKLNKTGLGRELDCTFFCEPRKLESVQVGRMLSKNRKIMDAIVGDTVKRIKEMYDQFQESCDIAYIGFSGGKDSVVLLDLCHRVLPLSVPVVFSDTDMELPDTYAVWEEVQRRYPGRPFIKVRAETSALANWYKFGPPSRSVRWCCSVHKSAPALCELKRSIGKSSIKALAFLGVRGEESLGRSVYDDIGEGVKNASQINGMPILDFGAHELYLYILANDLPLSRAYRFGLPRVGCIMCPEASDKYAWYVDAIYPGLIEPYRNAILQTNVKQFTEKAEEIGFFATSGWQARKSGVTLKRFISRPSEKIVHNTVTWQTEEMSRVLFFEWLKTLGQIVRMNHDGEFVLHCRCKGLCHVGDVTLNISGDEKHISKIACSLSKDKVMTFLYPMRKIIHKALACVGCKTCESECPTGALLSKNGVIMIDSAKCVHCSQCHNAEEGCWRFMSMEVSNDSNSTLVKIDRYKHFGFKQEWVSMYDEYQESLFTSGKLGPNMIPAARNWFNHALLSTGKSDVPSKLLLVAHKLGADSSDLWDILWIGLVHFSALMKWFAIKCDLSTCYSLTDLFAMLGDAVKDSTKKGGLDSLKATFKQSPLGNGISPIVEIEFKTAKGGQLSDQIVGIKRVKKTISPLVMLYSFYVMAKASGRTDFTLTEMLHCDFESPFVSPIIAFGLTPDEVKGMALGLSTIHPDFISCSFALGLDQIKLNTAEKSLDDVTELILNA